MDVAANWEAKNSWPRCSETTGMYWTIACLTVHNLSFVSLMIAGTRACDK